MTGSADPTRGSLARRIVTAPILSRPALARDRVETWRAANAPAPLLDQPHIQALLQAIADHSPYLWRLASLDAPRLAALLATSPEERLSTCLDVLEAQWRTADTTTLMAALRRAKGEIALLVALADLGGVWDLAEVTGALTRFADSAVAVTLRLLLRDLHRGGKLQLPDPEQPEAGCGLVIVALGKQGGGELNYSSDIDIVAFFDPACPALADTTVAAPLYVRLIQSLARILSERTGDGYALRVDLRLRPDPGSTAVAIGLPSAFAYYERHGQNWERAALIKARPVAGDLALGRGFLDGLSPFIWRKYFDYAAIADIHAMKRQIHAVRGHTALAVAGHDVKLGRGGIREIEFFVQTQQLIFGGRRTSLRGARTLAMLAELQRDGWVTQDAVDDLSRAYVFLRGIEHRLQMINDEQTQRLPADPEALARFAAFAGFATEGDFAKTFLAHARAVETHYARLFEHAPALDSAAGNLVFTGVDDDPDTLDTLAQMGFKRPAAVAETVRGWHFGRRAAVQGPRAREILTDLVPDLLRSLSRSGDPDGALAAFDHALGRMPAATELFAILRSNRALRDLFGDILGTAPRLARAVTIRPHLLDAAIDPAMLQAADPGALAMRVAAALDPALPPEDFLDRARDVAQEEAFGIGLRLLTGTASADASARAYSDLAASVVRATLANCLHHFEADHGRIQGGACVVLAMGKLGSREMTASSDLDLILIYDADAAQPESDGARPLDAARYYARLTQRLISALTVATRRGRLYDVDMRLRPSGGQGPVATQIRRFINYQAEEAQPWEHMALTRARVIAGDGELADAVAAAIRAVLTMPRDGEAVRVSVRQMRALVAKEKPGGGLWDLKLAPGGLLDLEFIAQALVLSAAADYPTLVGLPPAEALGEAGRIGLLDGATAAELVAAHDFYTGLSQVIRLVTEERFDPTEAAEGVLRRVAQAGDSPDPAVLEARLRETEGAVRVIFERSIGPVAEANRK